MPTILRTPVQAGQHLAVWLVWRSVGVSLLPPERRL